MTSKIKLQIALPKPRNPVCLPARQRKAGAHQSKQRAKQARREQKYQLHQILMGRCPD